MKSLKHETVYFDTCTMNIYMYLCICFKRSSENCIINQIQNWLMKIFFYTRKSDKVQSKRWQNCIPFWNLHTLKSKENIHLEYMNINRKTAATWLMFDIKHQPDTVLVDVWWKMFFHASKNDKVKSKRCKNFTPFLVYIPWDAKKTYT